jgi:Asp-tRNA(Asn)/Glu-tRNA(Gln) amidotransferase A subunit family amidase
MATPLHALGAAEAVALLHRGEISARELLDACLARIEAEEPRVGAFEHLDPAAARAQADRVDALRPRPPLAGLPVAVKDVIDTADLLTERGSPVFRGRRPEADAVAVARLRAAGAVILGKTVTTELAFYAPGKTRNPHDPARTPGGSSSGSAAAVAAEMVPCALGTQTAGSLVRPAAFCGVVALKPTFGLLPVGGISPFAPSLDTLGVLVRRGDLDALPLLLAAMGAVVPAPTRGRAPRIGLCRTAQWPQAEPATRARVEEVAARLARAGAEVLERELGPDLDGLAAAQRTIMAAEAARTLRALREAHDPALSQVLRDFLAEGDRVTPEAEDAARALAALGRRRLPAIFAEVDVLLTPAAIGEAPAGLASTGDPAFNRIWTLLGAPCLALPAGRGPAGLPLGVQLVGGPSADGALVAAARWIEARL